MNDRPDDSVSITHYIDARIEDLVLKHQGDLQALQAEIDRRIDVISKELGNFEKRLGEVESTTERQRGRMAAYAVISGIILIVLSLLTLFIDHIIKV